MTTDGPKVTLLSWTNNPIETVHAVWEASKGEEALLDPAEVAAEAKADSDYKDRIQGLFLKILEQRIPIAEHVNFVFMLEGVSVSFREQMVRHRIGTCASPERMGLDIVPDLAKSSWWSQSMRIQSMERFAVEGSYRRPDSVYSNPRAVAIYEQAIHAAQDAYAALVAAGVPMEDARDVVPLGATHRISWSLNLAALLHVVGERSCWILQYGLWGPVIEGMVSELERKVDPLFRLIIAPPCIEKSADRFKSCLYCLENERREDGRDAHHPCPLYLGAKAKAEGMEPIAGVAAYSTTHDADGYAERINAYAKLWGRDPFCWRP